MIAVNLHSILFVAAVVMVVSVSTLAGEVMSMLRVRKVTVRRRD